MRRTKQMQEWLTVSLVEDIQRAIDNGVDVAKSVGMLQGATLPGLIEYRCLDWMHRSNRVPHLPDSITRSDIGQALNAVSSELTTGSTENSNPTVKEITPQSVEFFVIRDEEQLDEQSYKLFRLRFRQSAKHVGFCQGVATGISGALHEMTENAVIHAKMPVAALIGYRVMDAMAQFSVADVGRGVLASLRTCPDFQHLQLHNDAIKTALQDGTSRSGLKRGGLGFRQVFKSLTSLWGNLRFRSGEGCISMDGNHLDQDRGTETFPPALPGFQVTVSCRADGGSTSVPIM